jgi:hypothetical protein
MGKLEKIVPDTPPAPAAKAVLAHRKKLEIERDALRTGAAELALKSAQGDASAQAALSALHRKIGDLEFEINCNSLAFDLATTQDSDAESAWRALLQTMDPEEIIAGIGKELCCRRCQPGINGGCVISAAAPASGGVCSHPIRQHHLFHINDRGLRKFPYRDNPQASRVFDAACEKLNVRKEFA